MAENITIRPINPGENKDILLALHSAHFTSEDSATKRHAYVNWLLSNPVDGSIYLAAYVDGAFASFLAFMARNIVGFGRVFRAALATAAMTLPSYGGRGLYRRLAQVGWSEARLRRFDFAVGYTIRQYVLEMELKMGWSSLGNSPVMALPVDSAAAFRAIAPQMKFVSPLASPIGHLFKKYALRAAASATGPDCEITAVNVFPADCNELNQRLQADRKLIFAKDQQTLNWLYLSPHNPFNYDIFVARRADRLVGFAVGRKMDLLELKGYGILDLVSAPGNDDILAPLLARLLPTALAQNPEIIACLVSRNHPSYRALKSFGFVDSRRSFALIYRALQDGLPEAVADPNNWYNSWGNNDTV